MRLLKVRVVVGRTQISPMGLYLYYPMRFRVYFLLLFTLCHCGSADGPIAFSIMDSPSFKQSYRLPNEPVFDAARH